MSNKDYSLEDFLYETNTDLENIENDLVSDTQEDLENALEEAGQNLKKSLEKLLKSLKKEVRSDIMNFYHDNKQLVNEDLKSLNSLVKDILFEIKDELKEEINSTDDNDERKMLREMRSDVVRFSRKYNHAYHKLRLKLALGNAGVVLENFFK